MPTTNTKTKRKTPSAFFDMADTYRKDLDDDVHEQASIRRNNRRKSKAKLKTFSYNNTDEDYWDIAEEWDDDDSVEKFSKRR